MVAATGVSPASYHASVDPGDTVHVTKTVTTPEIPPKPDIVLVVDETGSMGPAIANVKAEMGSIVSSVQTAQPQAQFAVASYYNAIRPSASSETWLVQATLTFIFAPWRP